jgi:hypothetical protein
MSESPEDRVLHQQIKDAADDMRQARANWVTSQVLASKYLAARERQLEVLEQVKAVRPKFIAGGVSIDEAIDRVAANIASVKAKLPTLPPHGPVDHYYTTQDTYAREAVTDRQAKQPPDRKEDLQTTVRLHRSRRRITLISIAGAAVIAAATTGAVLLTRPRPPSPGSVSYIATAPNGILVDASPGGHVILWNITTRHVAATLTDPGTQGIVNVAFDANGKEMAIADGNGGIYEGYRKLTRAGFRGISIELLLRLQFWRGAPKRQRLPKSI